MSMVRPGPMPEKRRKETLEEKFSGKVKRIIERRDRRIATIGRRWLSTRDVAGKESRRILAETSATRRIKRLPSRSPSMNKKWPGYEAAVKEWRAERELQDGFQCQFEAMGGERCRNRAHARPHHKAGRLGENLADRSKFMAVCTKHHNYIHRHPEEAESLGYIIREYAKH